MAARFVSVCGIGVKQHPAESHSMLRTIGYLFRIKNRPFAVAECDCGNFSVVNLVDVRSGNTQSCGCLARSLQQEKANSSLTMRRFGRLTALQRLPSGKWQCICICGKIHDVSRGHLMDGSIRSCGCLSSELSSLRMTERRTTHGLSLTHEYWTWSSMKQRCCNNRCHAFPDYGGRGIRVCDRWLNSFENFHSDMGNRPDGMTIERQDNNWNYCPENCIWATRKSQGNNKRNCVLISVGDITQTLSEWCDQMGISHATVSSRISHGWDESMAVITPVDNRFSHAKA